MEQGRPLDLPREWADGALAGNGEPLCAHVPAVVRGLVVGVCCLIGVPFALATNSLRSSGGIALVIVTAMVAAALGSVLKEFSIDRPRRRIRDRAFEHGLALCLRCGEPLNETRKRSECSSCFQPYELRETRNLWQAWLRSKHLVNTIGVLEIWQTKRRGEPVVLQKETTALWQAWLRGEHLASKSDFEEAKRVASRNVCVRCGFDLRFLHSWRCPSCGSEGRRDHIPQ